jgi:hypothetical protein
MPLPDPPSLADTRAGSGKRKRKEAKEKIKKQQACKHYGKF